MEVMEEERRESEFLRRWPSLAGIGGGGVEGGVLFNLRQSSASYPGFTTDGEEGRGGRRQALLFIQVLQLIL